MKKGEKTSVRNMANEIGNEENNIEVIESNSKEEKTGTSNINLEQNINVVNIDMGKHSSWEEIDYEELQEWIYKHMVYIIIGGIFVLYSVALIVMGTMLVSDKRKSEIVFDDNTVKSEQGGEAKDIVGEKTIDSEEFDNITTDQTENEEIGMKEECDEKEVLETFDEAVSEEVPITEITLYDLPLVGASFSEKRLKATNSVGEELEDIFILSGGVWGETVAFYLDGKYDIFKANLCCLEKCSSFYVNIYLDDGPCVQTVYIQQIMAKTPIEIDVTGVTFIKFECMGSIYNTGAILSDGKLHIADEVDGEN